MRSLRRLAAVLLLATPLALTACKQGVGDRCQVDSDCDEGLRCVLPLGQTPQEGGSCQPPGGGDAGVTLDLAGADSATGDLSRSTTD